MDKIKIEDLSIGDWVQDKNGKYAQILGIENWSDGYVLNVRINGVDVGCVPASSAYPIPITPEILEKNGLKNKSNDYIIHSNDCMLVRKCGKTTSWRVVIYDSQLIWLETYNGLIEHTHQLQHALRLAGVNKEINLQ